MSEGTICTATNRALLKRTAIARFAMIGNDIKGNPVGIVGTGQIGRLTSKYANAFDMREDGGHRDAVGGIGLHHRA